MYFELNFQLFSQGTRDGDLTSPSTNRGVDIKDIQATHVWPLCKKLSSGVILAMSVGGGAIRQLPLKVITSDVY